MHSPAARPEHRLAQWVRPARVLARPVPLVHPALLVHNKRHHAALAIFGGPRHERKAADHFSVDDIIVFAAGRVFALTPEDLGFISVKRLRLTVGSFVVALGCGLGCEWAERTDFTIEFRQPVKTGFRVG